MISLQVQRICHDFNYPHRFLLSNKQPTFHLRRLILTVIWLKKCVRSTTDKAKLFTTQINNWKIFSLEKTEPHLQLSFDCVDGLLVKNLYLRHPQRKYTIKFLSDIHATGSFRNVNDLLEIIKSANFRPNSIEWQYNDRGDKVIVKINQY